MTRSEREIRVSVIVPARNAATTLSLAIASLQSQTFTSWEAIVVDDGSTDETLALMERLSNEDPRVRILAQAHAGVGRARNAGIAVARGEYLLFLDADDEVLPRHLERMTDALASDSSLDAVHCGWRRVAPNGVVLVEERCHHAGDLFDVFACRCGVSVHACLTRRVRVEEAGAFDESLVTCEDWDLWQRVARAGARFGAVPEVLAVYHLRQDSASFDPLRMLEDSLTVTTRGHNPDPRVRKPLPNHVDGATREHLAAARLSCVPWPAGLLIGRGEDATPLLESVRDDRWPTLDPNAVCHLLLWSVALAAGRTPSEWVDLPKPVYGQLDSFLDAFERQSGTPGLAPRVRRCLEAQVVRRDGVRAPLAFGSTKLVTLEITEPLSEVSCASGIDRLAIVVLAEGERLGTVELPVCDGAVPASVIADAVVADLAWPILGAFFRASIYLDRGDKDHDRIGWEAFLQELWGLKWAGARFYWSWPTLESAARRRCGEDGWVEIEISEPLPRIEISHPRPGIVPLVGGAPLGVIHIEGRGRTVAPQILRAAITAAGGIELLRLAVREGVLGRSFRDGVPLRRRLASAAGRSGDGEAKWRVDDATLVPAGRAALGRAFPVRDGMVVLGRHAFGAIGTSASRRARLPSGVLAELREMAAVSGEPIFETVAVDGEFGFVAYAGEAIRDLRRSEIRHYGPVFPREATGTAATASAERGNFESLFAKGADPWDYANAYERTKYDHTLSLFPEERASRALELACAEGHFTARMAARVDSLVAADISSVALERAAKRCASLENVQFTRIDLSKDPIPGPFDLIVCSEVLYYLQDRKALARFVERVTDALSSGGHFLHAHANLVVDDPDRPGFDWDHPFGARAIGDAFARRRDLSFVKELKTPLYRVQLFRKEPRSWFRKRPRIVEHANPPPLPKEVARRFLRNGGSPRRYRRAVETTRLPILMYHRVCSTGANATAPYRVSPSELEVQLEYLRDAGYRSVRLDEWRIAADGKKPLPGRALIITFDDGYLDFHAEAWPLLKQCGFGAIVFLVTDCIGKTNVWDSALGEEAALMGWNEILELRDEGVEFGSHSATHRALTVLSCEEVAREALLSRRELERGIGLRAEAFAYPYGDVDPAVQHLVGACGFSFGLTCRAGRARFESNLLSLPRIEVRGTDSLADFVSKLETEE